AVAQFLALVGLITAVFTRSGVLFVLPGPAAFRELHWLLVQAARQVQVGVPPVPESTELMCLIVIVFGLVAVVVDVVAVSAAAPAASGLVLLCVVAVPASLADRLLPWWSFLLGALGFALLLTMDRQRRHLVWSEPAGPGGHFGSAVAVAAVAVVLALLAGSSLTAVGTEGRLAGSGTGRGAASTGIGVNAFTSLRGQLDTGKVVELFRIRGLTQRTYLRALTLSRFTNGEGWTQGRLDGSHPAIGVPGRLPLPNGATHPVAGPPVQVQIEPVNYVDNWLPSFGYPLALGSIGADWRYDPNALTVFSSRRQRAEPYTEVGVLPQPDPAQLRATGPAGGSPLRAVEPAYLDTGGVDRRVAALAARVAAGAPSAYDATIAVNQWFTQPHNGFRYDLRTATGNSGDALLDFLFTGRTGYCEQFASAMAIMLRTLGVPARVAVGFTPGTVDGDQRVITTADAHAWVEAWFPGSGWLPFDPTPLADGRTVVPSYLTPSTDVPFDDSPPTTALQPADIPAEAATPGPDDSSDSTDTAADRDDDRSGAGIGLSAAGVLLLALLAGLTPLAVRGSRRQRRLHLVRTGGPQAASAAWEEVLAESADRGVHPALGETVRGVARRLAQEHRLDEPGRQGLQTLVAAVERSWYGAPEPSTPTSAGPLSSGFSTAGQDDADELTTALDAVRASMARCAPTSPRARLLPRSVLRPRSSR
ncbi:MAG TPA: transglutaminaseTgpA domain-containing protein, partial [Pseudonocardiaceae bacterium]|nr:transglutaminaseTgpA domain-containing protein [Pseudonocardiaceae bacterium]